jgi:hypothetical protein
MGNGMGYLFTIGYVSLSLIYSLSYLLSLLFTLSLVYSLSWYKRVFLSERRERESNLLKSLPLGFNNINSIHSSSFIIIHHQSSFIIHCVYFIIVQSVQCVSQWNFPESCSNLQHLVTPVITYIPCMRCPVINLSLALAQYYLSITSVQYLFISSTNSTYLHNSNSLVLVSLSPKSQLKRQSLNHHKNATDTD